MNVRKAIIEQPYMYMSHGSPLMGFETVESLQVKIGDVWVDIPTVRITREVTQENKEIIAKEMEKLHEC